MERGVYEVYPWSPFFTKKKGWSMIWLGHRKIVGWMRMNEEMRMRVQSAMIPKSAFCEFFYCGWFYIRIPPKILKIPWHSQICVSLSIHSM